MTYSSIKVHPAITRFPSPIMNSPDNLSREEKIALIEEKFEDIMSILGLDLSNDSLKKTPKRIAEMYVNEIFSGLDISTFPEMTFITQNEQERESSDMVLVKASFISFCEHHFVPFIGQAYVAYIPGSKLIGLSKIPRLVRFFANRPQLQERLTGQIADSLGTLLEIEDVAVIIQATHYCVLARGVKDHMGQTSTHKLLGRFARDESIKRDFFQAMSQQRFSEPDWEE